VHRPDSRDAPDWAAKIHIAVAPVYYQNYLYGELIASQLTHAFGPLVDDPDAGRALVAQFFAPGAMPRWDRLIETATGSALSPNALVHDLAS
jgi:peptidyl-dipeptidase A